MYLASKTILLVTDTDAITISCSPSFIACSIESSSLIPNKQIKQFNFHSHRYIAEFIGTNLSYSTNKFIYLYLFRAVGCFSSLYYLKTIILLLKDLPVMKLAEELLYKIILWLFNIFVTLVRVVSVILSQFRHL